MKLLIIGSGGHAGQVIDAIDKDKVEIIGLIDDFAKQGEMKHGYQILGKISDIDDFAEYFDCLFIAIGNNVERKKIYERFENRFRFATVIHYSAIVCKNARISDGSYIGINAVVANNSQVHLCSIVNTNASLDHDSTLCSFSSLNPNSATGGNVIIGECTMIGMGTNIKNATIIGDNCRIGMGSCIISDVPSGTITKASVTY